MKDSKMKAQEITANTKRLAFPHEFIIVVLMVIIATILTYIIPSGLYERIESVTGRMVVDPDAFGYIQNTPVAFWKIPVLLVQGFYDSAVLTFSILPDFFSPPPASSNAIPMSYKASSQVSTLTPSQ